MNLFEGTKNWFESTLNTKTWSESAKDVLGKTKKVNWPESTKDLLEKTRSVNWSETTKDFLESAKNVKWSESTKDCLESAKKVNWSESTKNLLGSAKNSSWYESARNLCATSTDSFGQLIGAAKEKVEVRHLVIGGLAIVLVAAVVRGCGSGGASSSGGKIMKAPGGNGRTIYRDVFEGNPRGYFRDLRNR